MADNQFEQTLGTVPGTPASPNAVPLPAAPVAKEPTPAAPAPAPAQPASGFDAAPAPAPSGIEPEAAPAPSLAPAPAPKPTNDGPAPAWAADASPNAKIDNPFQQEVMSWRQAGYTWEQINTTVSSLRTQLQGQGYTDDQIAKTFGIQVGDLPELQQGVQRNVTENPPDPTPGSDPLQTFTDTVMNYSGLAELAHVTPPKPQAAPTDVVGQLAQAGGQIVGSLPETFLGARIGSTIGTAVAPEFGGTIIGGLLGAGVGLFLDAFTRNTYADASAAGRTSAPNFADQAAKHAVDAIKETVPAVAAMAVGGPADVLAAKALPAMIARFGVRPAAELAAITATSSVIQGKLPTWESTIDNAIILAGMHGAVGAAVGVKAGVAAGVDKLDQMTTSAAVKSLTENWAGTNEGPAEAVARIAGETRFDGLLRRDEAQNGPVVNKDEIEQAWNTPQTEGSVKDMTLDDFSPATRTRWYASAVDDGVDVANELLQKSGGNPDRFNELRAAHLEADFQNDPAQYGGDIDAYLTRMDSAPPISPEMANAAKLRMDDKLGKPVPPSIRLQATTPELGGIVRGVTQTLRAIFNPESMDNSAREAAALIRANTGTAARATAEASAAVDNAARREVNKVDDVRPIINYMEGKAEGAVLPATHGETQKAADTLKAIIDARRNALKLQGAATKGFMDDYWTHLWTDKKAAQEHLDRTKEGEWPTIGGGMAAGLEPALDPISAVMEYAANMDRAIAMNGVRDTAVEAGHWKYLKAGDQPEGWTRLKGPHADKVQSFEGPDGKPTSKTTHAYAPDGFARVYNNFVSKGMADLAKEYGDAYDYVQRSSNAISALKLALSGYHALTVTLRSFSNGMAQGIDELTSGHPIKAAKTFGTLPSRPLYAIYRGRNVQRIYQGLANGTDQDTRIVDLITEAGGRMAGSKHAIDLQFSQAGSYATSLMRGSLGAELKADVKETFSSPLGAVPVIARNVGRVLETLGQPLFQKYIPWLKNSATMDHVASWLERNPQASHVDALKATRYIVDQMDNRFGEMVHDNIFANKFAKQLGSITFLSWSWTVGEDIRAMGGGATDTLKFVNDITKLKKPTWTPKMSYLIAEPVVTAIAGAIYQYLKTGSWPSSPLDFFAPKTGGTVKGIPERAQVPGVMKDVFAFYDHPVDEVANKGSPLFHTLYDLWHNTDWREDPIAPIGVPGYNMLDDLKAYAGYIASNVGTPISASNMESNPAGSAFSPIETLLGFRQPTPLLRDPEAHAQTNEYFAKDAWRNKLRHDAKQAAQQAP